MRLRTLGLAVAAAVAILASWGGVTSPALVARAAADHGTSVPARVAMPTDHDPAAPELGCDTSCHVRPPFRRDEMHRTEACVACHMSEEALLPAARPRLLAQRAPAAAPAAGPAPAQAAPPGRPASQGILVSDPESARRRLKGRPVALPDARRPAPEAMVHVPEGEFLMGSNVRWEDEAPEYAIWLHGYFIDLFEVTQRDYARFVAATGHRAPEPWGGDEPPEALADHPVTHVDFQDAQAFCAWAGKRLPSEQEWEKAARGTDGRQYPWGNVFHETRSNNPQKESKGTEPVGSYPKSRSPYGLYDMSGNVWEWVDAWYQPHPGNDVPNAEYGRKSRISKGGSWYSCMFYNCGISAPAYNRAFLHPSTRNSSLGFRCVADDET